MLIREERPHSVKANEALLDRFEAHQGKQNVDTEEGYENSQSPSTLLASLVYICCAKKHRRLWHISTFLPHSKHP